MKFSKLAFIFLVLLSTSTTLSVVFNSSSASAAGFEAGRIIDDAVMRNDNSMTTSQIQTFLNSKMPSCDTWGKKMYNSTQTRAQYAASNGVKTPFVCLKDYSAGGKTAAQIIKEKANKYDINPQTLIVLLQKEQALVTDDWPWPVQYRTATGYGCPDTAPCDSQYYGLANQLDWAAKMFQSIVDRDPNWYSPYVAGYNPRVYWHPDLSQCGSQSLNIQNWSTASLYSYTPYRPNQAALDAGYGRGDSCSSYGNRNFYLYFKDWFGSPLNPGVSAIYKRHSQLGGNSGKLGSPTSDIRCGLANKGCYQNFVNGAILWTDKTGAWESLGSIRDYWKTTGWESGSLGYPTGPETAIPTGGWQQEYEKGVIVGKASTGYWESKGSIRLRWSQIGLESGELGYPTGPETTIPTGGWKQEYEKGVIIGRSDSGYWHMKGEILDRYKVIQGVSSSLGYPTSSPRCGIHKDGCYQNFEKGSILWTNETGAWESHGSIRNTWIKSGYERGALGYPTGPETAVPSGGWQQKYENGVITGKSSTGYWESKGSIRAHWLSINSHASLLGYPVGPETRITGGWQQKYENGVIFGQSSSGYWSSTTQIAKRHQELGGVAGKLGYPIAKTKCGIASDGCYQNFQGGAILWTQNTGAWESLGTIRAFWIEQGRETGPLGYPMGPEVQARDGSWSQQYENGVVFSKRGVGSATYR